MFTQTSQTCHTYPMNCLGVHAPQVNRSISQIITNMNTGNINKEFLKELTKPIPLLQRLMRIITVILWYFKKNTLLNEVHITYMPYVIYNFHNMHFCHMSFC